MYAPRIERHARSRRAASEEYHGASAPRRRDRLFPHFGPARGVDRNLRAVPVRHRAERGHGIRRRRGIDALGNLEPLDLLEPPAGLADQDHPGLAARRHHAEQTTERTMTEDHHRLTRLQARAFDPPERASQRFGEGGPGGRYSIAKRDDVAPDEARRQRDCLAISAVDEEQVLAQVRTPNPAGPALTARR